MAALWRFLRLCLSPIKGIPGGLGLVEVAVVIAGVIGLSGLTGLVTSQVTSSGPGVAGAVAAGGLILAGLFGWGGYRLQKNVDDLEAKPRPNVVFDGFAPRQFVRIGHMSGYTVAGIRFVNAPQRVGLEAMIDDLHAYIEISDEANEKKVLTIHDGGWSDDQGTSVQLPTSRKTQILDIVMYDDLYCYGCDSRGYPIRNARLHPGTYQVLVELTASNMVKPRSFHFTLTSHGSLDDLELIERAGFENACSSRWSASKRSPQDTEDSPPAEA